MADDFEGTVLIAEDDEAIRDGLSMSLEIEGYRVLTAADGREALELLPKLEPPCLLLLDLLMPVMNGWELLEAKNRDPALAPIPVVVLTADGRFQQAAQSLGAAAAFAKPFELKLLLRALERLSAPAAAETPAPVAANG